MKIRAYILPGFVGLLIGFVSAWITLRYGGGHSRSPFIESVDKNGDSVVDSKFYYDDGMIIRAEHDRNFDGEYDYFEFFENGLIKRSEGDDNFDGQIDTWLVYSNGNVIVSKHDTDMNGIPDVFAHLKFGVLNLIVWRPNETNRIERIEIYTDAVKRRTYIDKDGNGLLDTLLLFDEMERELSTDTLSAEAPPAEIMERRVRE